MPSRPWLAPLCAAAIVAILSHIPAQAADTPQPAAPKLTMAPGCKFQTNSAGRIRQGDNIPVSVRLRNTGQWCVTGFGLGGFSMIGTHIVDEPGHGELRVIPRRDGVVIAYRPKPGYTGGDTFLIGFPGDGGVDTHYSATVTVDP